ncbi:uracil DNA glycosylase [Coemansia sp. BCRC 34962]|nr:uracil DNA glycosylase [Coemansia sp. BCRC 34962]
MQISEKESLLSKIRSHLHDYADILRQLESLDQRVSSQHEFVVVHEGVDRIAGITPQYVADAVSDRRKQYTREYVRRRQLLEDLVAREKIGITQFAAEWVEAKIDYATEEDYLERLRLARMARHEMTAASEASGSKRKTLDAYFGSKKAKVPRSSATPPSPSSANPAAPQKDKQPEAAKSDGDGDDGDGDETEDLPSKDRGILSLEYSTIDPSWLKRLKGELAKPYFQSLKQFLLAEASAKKTVYPADQDVYSWSRFAPFDKVRVVILGQDPYHGPGQAHGLAFSVKPGVRIPPSLANMYKGLARDFPDTFVAPNHGYLGGWAEQGVLLLNAALTVEAHKANSHANRGWEQFTDSVIAAVNSGRSNVVFMLWGSYAQKKGARVDGRKHLVLKTVHPSPLSASRGFFDAGHFRKANEYLAKHGLKPINWSYLPQ